MAIDWTKLKDNKQGKGFYFEKLAIDYLKDNFNGEWINTRQTRDGNKDAVSIVFFNKESWAEAKFTKHPRISRYRLDATVVSAIIHDNKVIEIIFITNSHIDDITQIDIEKALKNAIGESFNVVHFRTKLDIEFWLYKNPLKYKKYFTDNISHLKDMQFNEIIITKSASFFKEIRQSIYFREPLKELYLGETYEIIFSLFSPWEKENSFIKINTDLIELCQNNIINIKKGSNRICIKGKCVKTGQIPRYFICIENVKIETYKKPLIKESDILLQINSQNNIKGLILKSLDNFKNSNTSIIHTIKGRGGIGKSTLIENLLKSGKFEGIDIIYQSVSRDNIDSGILLINIILSVLFYHSAPSSIDIKYLEKIEEKLFVSSLLKDLIKAKNSIEKQKSDTNIENFNLKISEYTDLKELFPKFIELNKKVIILDDLHKLDTLSRVFLFNFLTDIYASKINCFIILCARNSFWQTSEYLEFVETNKIENYHYEFTNEDLCNNIELHCFEVDRNILSILANRVNIDIFFTSSLIRFLKTKDKILKNSNMDSRFAVINNFISDDGHVKSILEIFRDLSEQEKEILKIVYFSLSGIDKSHIKQDWVDCFDKLELSGHILINNNAKYVPFHDIYQEVFKGVCLPPSISIIEKYLNCSPTEYEIKRDLLLFSDIINEEQRSLLLENINDLIKNYKFYSALYILEPTFSKSTNWNNDTDIRKKHQLGETYYYNLQYCYAYSVANCDKNRSGNEEFRLLYEEIKNTINPEIKFILTKTLAELINSSFSYLSLREIEQYSNELKKNISDLEKEGYIKQGEGQYQPSYLLSLEINILTCLMLDQPNEAQLKNIEFEQLCKITSNSNKLEINQIRYARSIYHCNIDKSYKMIDKAITSLANKKTNENKWILLGKFELCFIQILRGMKHNFKDLKETHEKLKENYFNDYKKGCLVIAACYMLYGMKEQAYQYLYSNYFDKRQITPRFKAIRLSLLAIFECIFNNNIRIAIEYLKEQQKIFDNLGYSYKEIIEHNIKIITQHPTLIKKVSFRISNEKFLNDSLYIDPRIW